MRLGDCICCYITIPGLSAYINNDVLIYINDFMVCAYGVQQNKDKSRISNFLRIFLPLSQRHTQTDTQNTIEAIIPIPFYGIRQSMHTIFVLKKTNRHFLNSMLIVNVYI